MKNKQAYLDEMIETMAAEEEITVEHARERLLKSSDHVFDINKVQPSNHFWVDRGQVMSCEGALHPNHRAFKRSKA